MFKYLQYAVKVHLNRILYLPYQKLIYILPLCFYPTFSSLAGLEEDEKFVLVGWGSGLLGYHVLLQH